jgi:hypothetical protein
LPRPNVDSKPTGLFSVWSIFRFIFVIIFFYFSFFNN